MSTPSLWPCFARQMRGRPPHPALCTAVWLSLSEARPRATLYAVSKPLNSLDGEELVQASISQITVKVQYFLSGSPGAAAHPHVSFILFRSCHRQPDDLLRPGDAQAGGALGHGGPAGDHVVHQDHLFPREVDPLPRSISSRHVGLSGG